MTLGDVLEWFGGASIAAAAYLWHGLALMLVVLAVVFVWEAQCYDTHLPPVHPILALKARRSKKSDAKATS